MTFNSSRMLRRSCLGLVFVLGFLGNFDVLDAAAQIVPVLTAGTSDPSGNVTKLNAAITMASTSGQAVYIKGAASCYRVNAGIVLKAGVTIYGDGYPSCLDVPDAGWALSAPDQYGILNVKVDNVTIRGLRLRGTKLAADSAHNPKLIYYQHGYSGGTAHNLTVVGNRLENASCEGLWGGPTSPYTTFQYGLKVLYNDVYDVGVNCFGAGGLQALHGGTWGAVFLGNTLDTVGTGIAMSGENESAIGNVIRNCSLNCIGTGDTTVGYAGPYTIVGNTIEISYTASVTHTGILLDGGAVSGVDSARSALVSSNTCNLKGDAADIGNTRCFAQGSHTHAIFEGNIANINVRGIGFRFGGTAGAETATKTVYVRNNICRVTNESGSSYCFSSIPGGAGYDQTVHSSGNSVSGLTRAGGSYAYYYSTTGGGKMNAYSDNDFTTGGNIQIGSRGLYAGEVDNLPFSSSIWTGTATVNSLKTTGAARGKKVVCVDTATGILYASSTGTDCSN